MTALSKDVLERFVKLASHRLTGRWVLLGGNALAYMGADFRPTMDIDLAGPDDADQRQVLVLMEIAEELGLPVEAVNQAGAFFLRRIPGWQDHLIEIADGENTTLCRPDATLFLLMKIGRMSEVDFRDCLKLLEIESELPEEIDRPRVVREIQARVVEESNLAVAKRLALLKDALG